MPRKKNIEKSKITLIKTHPTLIDVDKARDQILTEVYLSSECRNKVRKVILDMGGNVAILFPEVYQEVFYQLGRKDPEYIFKEYCINPGNIIALALKITERFFLVNPLRPDYPGHTPVSKQRYASVLHKTAKIVTSTDSKEDTDNPEDKEVVLPTPQDDSYKQAYINTIDRLKTVISPEDYLRVQYYMNLIGSKNKAYKLDATVPQQYLKRNPDLFDIIKDGLAKLKINSLSDILQ